MTHSDPLRRTRRRAGAVWGSLFGLVIVMIGSPAEAHAPDEYGHNVFLSLPTGGVLVEMTMTAGPLVGGKLETLIDSNGDGSFSDGERAAYGDRVADDVRVAVDGLDRPVVVTSVTLPDPIAMRAGSGEIRWVGIAAGPAPMETVEFYDGHQVLPGNSQASLLATSGTPKDFRIDRGTPRTVVITGSFDQVGSASQSNNANTTAAPSVQAGRAPADRLQGLVGSAQSPGAMAVALGVAAMLGALHALTPGHGKTIAGAYLIGERATVRHALVLGSSMTVSHTSSVVVLGAITLGLSQQVDPGALADGVRLAAGLIVLGIGLTLLVKRVRGGSGQGHVHPHGHSHDGHSHHDWHGHGHGHGHGHDHGHDHHDGGSSSHTSEGRSGLRRLIALGASGGLLPCPEALGLLVIAVSIQRQLFGFAMIVAFSLGLAGVLVVIGIALVRARSVVDRFATIPTAVTMRWLPILSALIVSVMGAAMLTGHVV